MITLFKITFLHTKLLLNAKTLKKNLLFKLESVLTHLKNINMKEITNPLINLVKAVTTPKIKVLFLGYPKEETILINKLVEKGCEVWHTQDKINSTIGYDLVITYGFRHIIEKELINRSLVPIINLHISYLPWNRGAHPNFWSFYDSTPSGVTIHLIDEGIDTGPILYQKYANFSEKENTFSKTYNKLVKEIEQLFLDNIDEIINKNYIATPQSHKGTFHSISDLPEEFAGWDSEISREVIRLSEITKKTQTN